MSVPTGLFDDKYEILHKIGEGGMGKVYKVRHVLLDDERVIKVIRQQPSDDHEGLVRRFVEEARTATRLRHPGIAQLYDFTVAPDGTAVIVMEFIDGVTVLDLLKRHGPPPLGLTIEIALQALDALGYLHEEGYVHRDVSPDNLMLTKGRGDRPQVKLIDLGLAKRLDTSLKLTATGAYLGKVRYSAPEQFGEDGVDARSDVYSFGVMLYELLTGQLPITGEQFSELVGGHLVRPPRDFTETDPEGRVPPELRRIVLRTLEKDRDRRLGSAMELRRLLEPFRGPYRSPFDDDRVFEPAGMADAATVVTAQPATALPARPSSWTGRRLAIAAAVVIAVVLAVAGGLWLARPDPGEEEFRLGVQALRRQEWRLAADRLREAIAASPRERLETVEIEPGVEEPYLPHFFLGQALDGMHNYPLAWDAWQVSEDQGAIGELRGRHYQELEAGRRKIGSLDFEDALRRAAGRLSLADDHVVIVQGMLDDAALAWLWQELPDLAAKARSTLARVDDARRGLAVAHGSGEYARVRAVEATAEEVNKALLELRDEIDALLEKASR